MKHTIKKNYDGLSYTFEDTLLYWLGNRIFHFVTADSMSYLALCASFGIGFFAWLGGYNVYWFLLVIPALMLRAIGDGLDGKIAKLRHEERPKYGYYMDRIFDISSFAMAFIGLHFSAMTHSNAWLYVLIFTLLHMSQIFVRTRVTDIFDMQIGKFGGGEILITGIFIVIIVVVTGNPSTGILSYTLIDIIGYIVAGLLGISYVGVVIQSLYGSTKIRDT